ncbi:DUF488 domain-containing protein [Aliiglaciecola sp. SL4]|uniref:DUF488 domain-containing protein n=1 Tax=Aliiglaciecola sp. SL4 TaxID=3239806 RepID=UPI00355C1D06
MNIKIHRIYDSHSPKGYRVLIDKLWPRGISKSGAALDDWWKDIAPDNDLRKWFNHDSKRWSDFRKKYLHQLSEKKALIKEKLKVVDNTEIILLYASKNARYTHARVLREYINRLKT